MKLISSKTTFIHKVSIFISFGIVYLILITNFISKGDFEPLKILIFPILVSSALGYFISKKILFELLDEVYDCGEFLLVKNKNVEDIIPLNEIIKVRQSIILPHKIKLSTKKNHNLEMNYLFCHHCDSTVIQFKAQLLKI